DEMDEVDSERACRPRRYPGAYAPARLAHREPQRLRAIQGQHASRQACDCRIGDGGFGWRGQRRADADGDYLGRGSGKMIFVTGAAGMVGSYLAQVFPKSELFLTDMTAQEGMEQLDTRDREAVMEAIGRVKPATVLHLAAETDVDRCEREPDHAYRSNSISTLNVALACAEHNAAILYISTAGVFDGTKSSPYTEFDPPSPITVYGKAKYEGEQFVQEICPRWYILRAGWMFGGGARDKKFVGKIAARCLANDGEIRCVDDKFGSPTFAKDLLDTAKLLIDHRLYGLYHGVNRGWCSRYEV